MSSECARFANVLRCVLFGDLNAAQMSIFVLAVQFYSLLMDNEKECSLCCRVRFRGNAYSVTLTNGFLLNQYRGAACLIACARVLSFLRFLGILIVLWALPTGWLS